MTYSNYHPVVQKIHSLLLSNQLWHEVFEHEPVRTSEEAAAIRTGYSLEQGAKALILQAKRSASDKFFCMLVIPGNHTFNSKKVTKMLNVKSIRFATTDEVSKLTGGVLIGGVSPWGSLFKLPTYVDSSLTQLEKIIFNAGDRSVSIAMNTKEYLKYQPTTLVDVIADTKQ